MPVWALRQTDTKLPLPILLKHRALAVCGLLVAASPLPARAQEGAAVEKKETAAAVDTLPEVVVSAPKLGKDLLTLPLSATVTTGDVIDQNAIRTVKDAAIYSPNTFFTEFSARKLSNPRFRGIGASPANPGVTTYIDGVPQLNSNSASIELLDVEQIDFVRGPAGALFGRNTVGGLINITSRRPSLNAWGGEFESTFGNYNLYDFRGRVTGPLIQDQLGFSFAGGYNERDGYTKDLTSGDDIDNRSAYFGKTQFLWTPNEDLEVRFIIAGESSKDGDYALNDLGQLRRRPRESSRSFLGSVERDIIMPTLDITYHADGFDFSSITSFVRWRTEDITDLDYTAGPIISRRNEEEQHSFTQDFRFSSPLDKPVVLSESAKLSWQAGLFYFYNEYEQDALSLINFGMVLQRSTLAEMSGWGLGAYAQGTLTLADKLDITAGFRWDYEDKDVDALVRDDTKGFNGGYTDNEQFSQVTPQAAITYHFTPDLLAYASVAGGYKAGGFNNVSANGLPGSYDDELSWNYEVGVKGRALENKMNYSLAFFYTDSQDLQLNVANTAADYHITNAGDAVSKGLEVALNYRVLPGWDVFGSAGWQDSKFSSGSRDNNPFTNSEANVAGNKTPFTPDYTATFGTQVTWDVGGGYSTYARGDVQFIGAYDYDSINGAGQDAYTLANFRVGVRNKNWFIEGYINNALDTEYVPMAIPYPGLAASGYAGESGAPVTFGVRVGVKF